MIKVHVYIKDPEAFAAGKYENAFVTSILDNYADRIPEWIHAGVFELDPSSVTTEVNRKATQAIQREIARLSRQVDALNEVAK